MSINLHHQAAGEATPFAFLWRQLFQSIPSIPRSVDLSDQTALITGANTGLGFESARQLLQLGLSHIIVAVRSQARGDAAAKQLQAEFPSATVQVSTVDMTSYDSIMDFAKRCESLERLDIVILNAGLSSPAYERTEAGHELTLQVNYLSTALLALVFTPILKAKRRTTGPARLSLIGSDTSYYADLKHTDLEPILESMDNPARFDSWEAYKSTKLLLKMFTHELSKRTSADDVIINVPNPGACRGTQFGSATERSAAQKAALHVVSLIIGRSPVAGARQYVDAITTKGAESHGSFVSEGKIKP